MMDVNHGCPGLSPNAQEHFDARFRLRIVAWTPFWIIETHLNIDYDQRGFPV